MPLVYAGDARSLEELECEFDTARLEVTARTQNGTVSYLVLKETAITKCPIGPVRTHDIS